MCEILGLWCTNTISGAVSQGIRARSRNSSDNIHKTLPPSRSQSPLQTSEILTMITLSLHNFPPSPHSHTLDAPYPARKIPCPFYKPQHHLPRQSPPPALPTIPKSHTQPTTPASPAQICSLQSTSSSSRFDPSSALLSNYTDICSSNLCCHSARQVVGQKLCARTGFC